VIIDKKDLRFQEALKKRVLFEPDHYDYGIKGVAISRCP
jgi:hypothetical protein